MTDTDRDRWKREAGEHAAGLVTSGMVVGLGTGSTAIWAVRCLAERCAAGELTDLATISTSAATEAEARQLGLPLTTLDAHPVVDLTIDGADEVDPALNLIKGGGGALLHEKIVAQASRRMVIVVDEAKLSPALGTRFRLPVEVVPFGAGPTIEFLTALGAGVELRHGADGRMFVSDEGNHILDAAFGVIADPHGLAVALAGRAAIVEHGLFLGLTTDLIVAGPTGIEHHRAAGTGTGTG